MEVAVAHVIHAKVNACAVCSKSFNQSLHRLWHPDLLHVWHRCHNRLTVAMTVLVVMVLITLIIASGRRFVSSSITIMILHHHIIIPIAISNIIWMGIIIFYLVEIFRHPVLNVENYLTREAYTGHCFEDDRLSYVVSNPHNSSLEAGLYPINLCGSIIPQPS
jgi:hypothetical protein